MTGAPNDPTTILNPPPEPLVTPRRIVITLIVLALIGGTVWVAAQGSAEGPIQQPTDAIVAIEPRPGARVLRQAEVGAQLRQGYDGRLTINGIEIPEDQMSGAIAPGSEAYAQLSPEERELGPRPNNKNVVRFKPGPGTVISRLPTGEVDIVLRYWSIAEGEANARTFPYTIVVS